MLSVCFNFAENSNNFMLFRIVKQKQTNKKNGVLQHNN